MKYKLLKLCILCAVLMLNTIAFAQVTIGSGQEPNIGSLLDLKMDGITTKGLGLPRVNLQKPASLKPCADETENDNGIKHIGLVVYNIAKSADVCPGMYVWSGNKWERLYGECADTRMQFNTPLIAIQKSSSKVLETTIFQEDGKTRNYTWTSSDPSVASISTTGLVTGIKDGTCIIKVVSNDGEHEATCKVFVIDPVAFKYKFRIHLSGKPEVSNNPADFLTQKAIDRRQRQGIAIDFSDLPISLSYIQTVQAKGGIIAAKSKWLNTLAVHVNSLQIANDILSLPFVEDADFVWRGTDSNRSVRPSDTSISSSNPSISPFVNSADYGSSWLNISLSGGENLHGKNYKGQGIEIAILDAGFQNFRNIRYFDNIDVKEIKSFVRGISDADIITNNAKYFHGTEVLSCLGTNKSNEFIGTAPETSYRLFMTEDHGEDYPIEEDYMVNAMEYADSLGVDMMNISLYYPEFDTGVISYTHETSDGRTAHCSKGATLAVEKGMFIVACAGNKGGMSVRPPADSPLVLTVGGIQSNDNIWDGTSFGITIDGRIKPDVVALGANVPIITPSGTSGRITTQYSGTSFASPIMCGLVACLWQAYPKLTSMELLQIVRESSDRNASPSPPFGYGKPNWETALEKAKAISDTKL